MPPSLCRLSLERCSSGLVRRKLLGTIEGAYRRAERLRGRMQAATEQGARADGHAGAGRVVLILHAGLDVEALYDRIGRAGDRTLLKRCLPGPPQPARALGAGPEPAFGAEDGTTQLPKRRSTELVRAAERAHAVVAREIGGDLPIFLAQVVAHALEVGADPGLVRRRCQMRQPGETASTKQRSAIVGIQEIEPRALPEPGVVRAGFGFRRGSARSREG